MPLYPLLLATISPLIQVFHFVSKVARCLRYPILSLFVSVAACLFMGEMTGKGRRRTFLHESSPAAVIRADEIEFTTLPQPIQTTVIRETHIPSATGDSRFRQDGGISEDRLCKRKRHDRPNTELDGYQRPILMVGCSTMPGRGSQRFRGHFDNSLRSRLRRVMSHFHGPTG
jgi:hypothetical protein